MARRKERQWRIKEKNRDTEDEDELELNDGEIRKAVETKKASSTGTDHMRTIVEGLFDTIEKLEEANRSTLSALKRNGVIVRKTIQKLNNMVEIQEQMEKELGILTKTCEQNSKLLSKMSTLVITQSLQ